MSPHATDPFGPTANPHLYVERPACQRVLARLHDALEDGPGVAVLSGPAGIGKTLLLRVLAAHLGSEYRFIEVPYPALPASDLCAWVLRELGGHGSDPERDLVAWAAEEHARGRPLVLTVDDAHSMPMESAARLMDLALGSGGALRVIASLTDGDQAEGFLTALEPGIEHVRFDEPMTAAELADYIVGRLDAAGTEAELRARFDSETLAELDRLSGGVPGLLHEGATNVLRGRPAETPAPTLALADEEALPTEAAPTPEPEDTEPAATSQAATDPTSAPAPRPPEPPPSPAETTPPSPTAPARATSATPEPERPSSSGRGLLIGGMVLLLVALAAIFLPEWRDSGTPVPPSPPTAKQMAPEAPEPKPEPSLMAEVVEPDPSPVPAPVAEIPLTTPDPTPELVAGLPPSSPELPAEVPAPGPDPASALVPSEPTREAAVVPEPPPPGDEQVASTPAVPTPEAVPEPVAPVTPSGILLHINATPWAEIEIDGHPVGVTPLAGLEVTPGRHRVVARMFDGRELRRDVEISPDQRHLVFE